MIQKKTPYDWCAITDHAEYARGVTQADPVQPSQLLSHLARTHLSLEMDTPEHRPVQPPDLGRVIEFPDVAGLQRHYERHAA